MKDMPTLVTKRLMLRPFMLSDGPTVQQLAGDIAIADTTLNLPHPYKNGMAENWISAHAEAFDKLEGLTLAVTSKADKCLLGAISLMSIAKGHLAELGYWVGKPYWNQGFCTEAGGAIISYAFTDLGLIRVHAAHFARNPASGRVMKKLGMQHEGTRRQHVRKWDNFEDLELYGILRQDWESMQGPARHLKS